jgi:hypothetical protein
MKLKTASAWALIAIALTIASCTKQDVKPTTPDSENLKPPKECCLY